MSRRKIIIVNLVCIAGAVLILAIALMLRWLVARYLGLPEQVLKQNVSDVAVLAYRITSFSVMVGSFSVVMGLLNVILLIKMEQPKL